MDRVGRRPGDEGSGSMLKRSTRKSTSGFTEDNDTSTTEWMTTILAQRKSYMEVENMRDQQNILQQRLGPLQEEAVRVIGELATVQGKVK
jgi:hypothetical protein